MKPKTHKYWTIASTVCIAAALLCFAGVSMAVDETPFFAGGTGLPNVVFIFDNSDSMQDCAYFRKNGNTYRPSTYWRRGVTIDEDGTIAENASGGIIYDESKYTTATDTPMVLPGQTPPDLPGLGSPASDVTYIPGDSSDRIYDSNVDWPSISSWSDFYPYRYWKVKITDDDGVEQIRNIYSCSSSSGYWTVYGDPIDYTGTEPFTYELMQGFPGEVTYKNESDLNLVYDKNFDWSTTASWSDWSNNYRYKRLEVYAGTNEGEIRTITGRTTSYGYWTVDEPFPVACDYTTRYRILSSPDDNKYAKGGNHPDSKLFQAKQALSYFLDSDSVYRNGKYLLNMGFATYMQARIPRVRATYYYKYTYDTPDRCRAYYWRWRDTSANFYDPNGPENGYDIDAWGTHYEDVLIGDQIDGPYYSDTDCRHHIIHYTVTERVHDPTDSLPNRYRIHLSSRVGFANEGGYKDYSWRYFDVPEGEDCPTYCDAFVYPDPYDDGSTWFRAIECDEVYPPGCVPASEGSYYRTYGPKDTYGDYAIEVPPNPATTPMYINKDTLMVTPYKGHCSGIPGDDWLCENPDPDAGNYTLIPSVELIREGMATLGPGMVGDQDCDPETRLDECTEAQIINGECDGGCVFVKDVVIDSSGTIGHIQSNVYDYSYFRYPGRGNEDQPHAWSYRKAYYDDEPDNNWIYRYGSSTDEAQWRDDMQKDPFFPADVGDEMANHEKDDHTVFVNLPRYDPKDANSGDDVIGNNLARIKKYISLARVEWPSDTRYRSTMMPYTNSLASNSGSDYSGDVYSTAVTGKGTPLGASLENARKYYESYAAQDTFTQGACRDNYVILLTDGLETCNGDPVAAAAALNTPLIADEPETTVKTYVIGFGLDDASKVTLDAIAEAGGCDQYKDENDEWHYAYFASNLEELITVLTVDIMSEILGSSYTRSAPVISYNLESGTNQRIYYAYFDYPVWRGHLNAYELVTEENKDQYPDKSIAEIAGPVAEWTGDCDPDFGHPDTGADADAGCEIKLHGRGTGTVYTVVGGNRIQFSTANLADLKPLVNPDAEDINGNGTPDENADADAVIGYTLNPGYDSGNYVGTRDPDWPLGDLYHSKPVVVTKPRFTDLTDEELGYSEEEHIGYGYETFMNNNELRDTIIYVGSNDGMLHAINDSNGQERWAWIPNCVLGDLHRFKDGHTFTVDLTIKAADIDLNDDIFDSTADKNNRNWRSIVVSGLMKGGNHYYAIDVTNPDDPQPLWEITDDNMGNTWSIPAFGRINIDGVATSVIFVGGGYSTTEDVGNRIYIIKAADGTILKEITVGSTTNNVPSELLTVKYSEKGGIPSDFETGQAVDSRLKGFIEMLYFGDTNGTLWKLKGLNADSSWDPQLELELLFAPENPRPIYHSPVIGDGGQSCDRRFILFGTGDENDPIGINQNYFYEIEDRAFDDSEGGPDEFVTWKTDVDVPNCIYRQMPGDPEDHVVLTQEQIDNGLFRMTWTYNLPYKNVPEEPDDRYAEKVLSDPTAYRGAVYFTTYQPEGGCDMGYSYLYALSSSQCPTCGGGSLDVGGEGALEYGIPTLENPSGKFDEPHVSIELGKSIASSPTLSPPMMYINTPGGGPGGMQPPVQISLPMSGGKLLFWWEAK